MSVVDVVSLTISAVALGTAAWAHVREYRLNKRTVVLEEARETDRRRRAVKASLVADICGSDKVPHGRRLQVENRGESEARDIVVLLDGVPVLDHPGVRLATQQGLNKELTYLPSGGRFRYLLMPTLDCLPPWELVITWTDDSGEQGTYHSTVTF